VSGGWIIILALTIWICIRRQRRRQDASISKEEPSTSGLDYIDPLILDRRIRTRRTGPGEKKEKEKEAPNTARSDVVPAPPSESAYFDLAGTLVDVAPGVAHLTQELESLDARPVADTGGAPIDQQAHLDLRQLFQNRQFEGRLLRFLTQRMDPRRPGSPERSDIFPPSYRPENE
jgi:hypothetical protein